MTRLQSSPLLSVRHQEPRIFLNAGDFNFGAAPLQLATLLGSCVTVTLWHPRRQIGGMCHFLAPCRSRQTGMALNGQFADEAFAMFDAAVHRSDSHFHEYQAKLFGGGDMFPEASTRPKVGELNIAVARDHLRQRGIPLLAEHAGGAGHRKLIFDIATGEVQIRFVDKTKEPRHD